MAPLTERQLIPQLHEIRSEDSLRVFFLSALMELASDGKKLRPGLAATMEVGGTVFSFEFVLTAVVPPHGVEEMTRQ